MRNKSLNEEAWKELFKKYHILQHIKRDGSFIISASQIKEYREPRLMTKFDHSINLPKSFADNELAILPITRGDYIISHFDAYHRFEPINSSVTRASLPDYIQSLDVENISSEAIALNSAVASGIIANFIDESDIIATVSGRMRSGSFSFDISDIQTGNAHRVDVNNSQIEIDAAYEGVSSLVLFEAKRDLSEDFLVRQLYYPYRLWQSRVSKPVRPVFFIYSNGIYRLFEYKFEDMSNYNSLRLVKQQNYSIEDTAISINDIQNVLDTVSIVAEPRISFPQADKFERVINLCELVSAERLSRAKVTELYAFDVRQTNYYTDAARYLGLIEKGKENETPVYSLSEAGRRILSLGFKQRQLAFCNCILSHKAFNDTLQRYLQTGEMPSTEEIVDIMKRSNLYRVESDSTYVRRSSSIKSWINWIISLINE